MFLGPNFSFLFPDLDVFLGYNIFCAVQYPDADPKDHSLLFPRRPKQVRKHSVDRLWISMF